MPNRIIKESICTSANLDGLSWAEEVFFYRIIVNCDDFGRCDGRPTVLRAKCFPLKLSQVSESHIKKWIDTLIRHELIYLYEITGQAYLQVKTWDNHQQIRAKRSKYPDPNGNMISIDINGNHLISNAPVIQSNPNPIRIQSETVKRFDEFWKVYPKKVAKKKAEDSFKKINPDSTLLEIMLTSIERFKKTADWLKEGGRYIPYPATWLNNKRWEDEIIEDKRSSWD